MAEKVKIAELNIDNKRLLKELSDTKKSIDRLSNSQKESKKSGDTNSETFIKNQSELRQLRSEYNKQIKVLNTVTDANQKLDRELKKEIKSVDQAIKNNKELRLIRNQINADTEEGAKAIEELNEKLDKNTEFIKENSSSLEKLKLNIGNYKEDIKSAAEELNIFNGGLLGFINQSQEAGGAGNFLSGSLKKMTAGFWGLTKASLAFIATPIGALLAILAGAFLLVRNAMNRSEDSTTKIKRAFSAFGGIVKTLQRILEPLGVFLIDGIVAGFELAEKAIYETIDAVATSLDLFGFDEQAESLRNFNKEIQQGAKDAKILAEAEARLAKEQRNANRLQLDFQRQAENLRQIRDDENLTIRARITANEALGAVLKDQLKSELDIANTALLVAQLRIKADGETKEALDQQAEALERIADIQERIAGQESEQLTNRVALQKEAAQLARERAEKRAEEADIELELLKEQNKFSAKTEEERLSLEKKFAQEEISNLKKKLNDRLITQQEYELEKLKIENGILEKEKEKEQKELERIEEFENRKRQLQEEIRLQNAIDEDEREQIALELEFEKREEEIEKLKLEAEQEKELLLLLEEEKQNALAELKRNQLLNQLEEKRAILQQEIELEEAQTQARIQNAKALVSILSSVFGESAALRIAMVSFEAAASISQLKANAAQSIAQINANTAIANAKSIAASPLTGGQPFVSINTAVAAKNIAATKLSTGIGIGQILASSAVKAFKKPKAEKGMLLRGSRHINGGININAEDGESIINRKSTAKYLPLLDAINRDGGGIPLMERGGIAGTVSNTPTSIIDYELLASKVAEANKSLPNPVVGVDEISKVANTVNVIESGAEF